MKLTKTRLKQLIKEELQNLAENEQFESPWPGKTSPVKRAPVWSAAATNVEDVLEPVLAAYNSLADNESKAAFEEQLLKNIGTYVAKWKQERQTEGA